MLLNGPAFSDDRLVRGDYALKPPSQNLAAGARAFFKSASVAQLICRRCRQEEQVRGFFKNLRNDLTRDKKFSCWLHPIFQVPQI